MNTKKEARLMTSPANTRMAKFLRRSGIMRQMVPHPLSCRSPFAPLVSAPKEKGSLT
jgi:hypothetical protein